MGLLLTTEQIDAGAEAIVNNNNRLTASMVEDLLSIFRGYLGSLAANYDLKTTLENEQDANGGSQKCAKLAACLFLFQENQFTPESGFAPTVANRTGFNYSMHGEVFEIFKYAFGLFWDIPPELVNKFNKSSGAMAASSEGFFLRRQ